MPRHFENIRRVPASRSFRVISVNRPPLDCFKSVLNTTSLVQSVSVNTNLNIVEVGNRKRGINSGRSRAPVLVDF